MRLLSIRLLLCWLPVCLLTIAGRAQDPLTQPLPDSLKEGAVMVRRLFLTEITIESMHKARVHRKWINTILNPAGDHYSEVYTFYDKFHDLSGVTAALYDGEGRLVKKVKKSDMEDANITGMGMLALDTRVKFYRFASRNYPYTISYEDDQVLDNLFVLPPQWFPQPAPNTSIVSSSLVVHVPAGYPLQYREYGIPATAAVSDKKGGRTYTWELRNKPAATPELFAVAWTHREPCVRLSAGLFEVEGYKGASDSWTDLGKFVGELFRGRGQLPVEARQKVHSLVDGLTDDHEKIAALYGWLQQNTHYVGIELGIGGWQPYDATYVYTRKYGDCKALANYMVAILKEAGIRAFPVLINGGPEPPLIDSGFACPQFNHCIAVAVTGKDSVWLECTSSTLPPGYLGGFTTDRDGLLLDETGGHLVHTPVYGVRENHLTRSLKGSIGDNGTLEGSLRIDYTGLEQDAPQSMIDRLTKKDLLEERRQSLGLPNCTISDLHYQPTRAAVPSLEESMQLSAEHFATITGNRLILVPGHFIRRTSRLQTNGPERRSEIELRLSVDETDSIVLKLPHGYAPERLPSGNLSYPFGSYHLHCGFENDVLTISCHYREQKGVYTANTYPQMARFFDLTYREGYGQIVFVKQ